jgi:putative ABC transport system permease protein
MPPKPPRLAKKILEKLQYDDVWKTTVGDFDEYFHYLAEAEGSRNARRWYWGQVIRYAPSKITHKLYWSAQMFTNYLKVAFRNIRKNISYSLINVSGLAVGIACFLLIGLFVVHELSYDSFYPDDEKIYRVIKEQKGSSYLGSSFYAVTPAPLSVSMKDEIPEVELSAYASSFSPLITVNDQSFFEEGISVHGGFLEIFPQKWIHGNPTTALEKPESIVLTERMANTFFDIANPVGETLKFTQDGREPVQKTVTGVIQNPPATTHLPFAFIFNDLSNPRYSREINHWGNNNDHTYIKINDQSSVDNISQKLAELTPKWMKQHSYYEANPDEIPALLLQPLKDIHLNSSHINRNIGVAGNISYLYILSVIGGIILLIAAINYMNLATARSLTRAKEIGVRKVTGAFRSNIIMQFAAEAVVYSALGMLFAFFIVYLTLPKFSNIVQREIDPSVLFSLEFLGLLITLGLFVGLISGSYPAIYLSSLKPSAVLKSKLQMGRGKLQLRNVLVVGQFTATIILIIGSLVVSNQMEFLQSRDVGFDRDQVLTVKVNDRDLFDRYDVLKQRLESHPGITRVSSAAHLPNNITNQTGDIYWAGKPEDNKLETYYSDINFNYVDILDMSIIAGRNLSKEFPADASESHLISESGAKAIGWSPEEAIGQRIYLSDRYGTIVGVVKDFSFLSAKIGMQPLFLRVGDLSNHRYLLIKTIPDNLNETIQFVENEWASFSTDFPFEYSFLDDAFNAMYQQELTIGKIFNYFTVLALFIACIGLFGLASFMMERRTKEIGIRKVLGANVAQILTLLNRDFLKLVALSFIIAAPAGWFLSNNWLQDFVYRIEVGPGIIILSALLAFGIALLTISFKSIKTAMANPVNSLKSE